MRVSDYVIQFLRDNYKVDTIFTVSGGGCIWLIDSLGKTEGVKYICNHHEQASAIAAEGYARMTGKLGVCIVTSGPGGTNTLTGVLGAYLDSIPMLIISGNVNKEFMVGYSYEYKGRQIGDQEFDIVNTVKKMTKYADVVEQAEDIKYYLSTACTIAMSDRPGPVWLDIPLNVQSKILDEIPENIYKVNPFTILNPVSDVDIELIYNKFINSQKPLMIVGNGIRLGNAIPELEEFLQRTNIPVISAVNGNDIVNDDYEYYCGRFGTHAQIAANKLINEADFILSVGSRLYIRQIGYNFQNFGKNAYKVYVDIDGEELKKFTVDNFLKIRADAKEFLSLMNKEVFINHELDWANNCRKLYEETPTVLERHRNLTDKVSNYFLIETLNKYLKEDDHIVTSDGGANVVTMQVVKLKGKQRLFTNTGCAAMGYGLPAAIGAATSVDKIILIEGDGSFHLNIHELQTIKHYNLPIKVLLLNNNGYNSIKITQNAMMKGHIVASTPESGVSFPNFEKIITAYGINYMQIKNHKDIDSRIKYFLAQPGPIVCEVFLDENEVHEPKVMAKVNEDGSMTPGNLEDIKFNI